MISQPLLAPARLLVAWVVALVVLANPVAHAETPPSDLIAPSLVYLKVDFTPTKGPSSGVPETDQATGFLVSEDGFILTSYHLLEKVGEYAGDNIKVTAAVGDPQALPVTAAIVNGLQPLDVLLLKIRTTRPLPPLTLGRADLVNVGDHIYTSGFHGTDPFNSEGTVSNKFGPLGIGYLWTVNMPVAAGQSGSPVYLPDGTVVGILKGESTGATNVGYMVPIEFSDALIAHLRLRELDDRLAKVEKALQDVSSNFEWRGQEIDGQIILEYRKLIQGDPQIKSVLVNVTPLITKVDAGELYRDRPLIKESTEVVLDPDGKGGRIKIPNVGQLITYRLQSTGEKIAISRLEVAIVAILNDKNNRMLNPVIISIETKRYAN